MDFLIMIIIVVIYGISRIPKILNSSPKTPRPRQPVWEEEKSSHNVDSQYEVPDWEGPETRGITRGQLINKENLGGKVTPSSLKENKPVINNDDFQKKVYNGIIWSEILSPPKSKQKTYRKH